MSALSSLRGRVTRMRSRPKMVVRVIAITAAVLVVFINFTVGPPADGVGRAPATDAEIVTFVSDQIRDSGIPGGALAIVRDGRVTTSQGFGVADASGRPVTSTTPFSIGSLSKSITATAVLQLVDAGKVDLDAPVVEYLPDFTLADADVARTITVRQLLDQTSGIPTSAGQRPLNGPVADLDRQVAGLADVHTASTPGTTYAYSNANYVILGSLIEQVSGTTYGSYIETNVFEPLAMTHAHADRAAADRDGLTQAHRLWFGLPSERDPLWRPDLVPAGFLMASAEDLGRFVAMELSGGSLDGHRVLSESSVADMQRGVAPMGLADRGRYGLGLADMEVDGLRMVGHSGSTTDMAAVELWSPDQRVGIVLLLNGQSTIYELAHKPDLIATAAFQSLVGREPGGTLAFLYPALDLLFAVVLGFMVFRLVMHARRMRRGDSLMPRALGNRWLGIALVIWLDAIVPIEILWRFPDLLAAPWSVLAGIDLGQVVLAFALLRLSMGCLLVIALVRALQPAIASRRAFQTAE